MNRYHNVLLLASAMASSTWAYETGTHEEMSRRAAERSLLDSPAMFQRLGLLGSLDGGGGLIFPSSEHREDEKRDEKSPGELMRFGSRWRGDRLLDQAFLSPEPPGARVSSLLRTGG